MRRRWAATLRQTYRKKSTRMEVRQALLLGALFVLLTAFYEPTAASPIAVPMPPRTAINHRTKQCAEIGICGDECSHCVLPEGWEFLGYSNEVECPPDYAVVEIAPVWKPKKVDFCCIPVHSGVLGDCEDVVINRAKQQCAFVDDINNCDALPKGWEKHGSTCSFTWVYDIRCLTEEEAADRTRTAFIEYGLIGLFALGIALAVVKVWKRRRQQLS
jgi:hypothetical protein